MTIPIIITAAGLLLATAVYIAVVGFRSRERDRCGDQPEDFG